MGLVDHEARQGLVCLQVQQVPVVQEFAVQVCFVTGQSVELGGDL
jgi:hypothetical protein